MLKALTNHRMVWVGVFGCLALVQLGAYFTLAFPYLFMPGEDTRYIMQPFQWLHQPVFTYWVENARILCGFLKIDQRNAVLISTVFAHILSAWGISWMVLRFTGSFLFALGAGTAFSYMGWTLHYLFYGSYSVVATALHLIVVCCLLESSRFYTQNLGKKSSADAATPRLPKEILFLLLAGFFSGLLLLSSPSAPLLVGCDLLLFWYLFRKAPVKTRVSFLSLVAVPCLLYVSTFFIRTTYELYDHLHFNIFENNLITAAKQFGFSIAPPKPSFFYVASVFSKVWFLTVSVALVAALVLIGKRKSRAVVDEGVKAVLLVFLAHALLIDFIPFTKLARTHFSVVPFATVLVAWSLWTLKSRVQGRGLQRGIAFLGILAVVLCVHEGMDLAFEIRRVKQTGPLLVNQMKSGSDFYTLAADPQGDPISLWLGLETKKVKSLDDLLAHPSHRSVLIIGPRGPGSGKSALRASLLPDFDLKIPRTPIGVTERKLPFHGYFKTFMQEEEVSQALYFKGLVPDYRADALLLSLWTWG